MWIFSVWCAIIVIVLAIVGRRQAVRHWVLVPAFAGSNPAVPAKLYNRVSDKVPRPLATMNNYLCCKAWSNRNYCPVRNGWTACKVIAALDEFIERKEEDENQ